MTAPAGFSAFRPAAQPRAPRIWRQAANTIKQKAACRRKQIPFDLIKWARPTVFWPPALLLLAALMFSLLDFSGFHAFLSGVNTWVLSRFDWLFNAASFAAVLLLAWVFFSPLGAVRIGGPKARPILGRWNWFAITLCTTIAVGILFWGAAEPMFHINGPPDFTGLEARSEGASRFALSSMFMHWTITPYAIYTVPALAFALAHYNLGRPYSLSGPLSIVFGRAMTGRGGALVDAVGLYALVAGVAGALGAGVMTLSDGLGSLTGLADGPVLRFAVTAMIVAVFVASSISGVQRGIRVLSDLNTRLFFLLAGFVLVFGPTGEIIALGLEGAWRYVLTFVPQSLALGERAGHAWTREWTVFYFAQWLAWAPITALFLGRIAVGYTVREFVLFNLAGPALFGALWMTIFGAAAIEIDAQTAGSLTAALNERGPEAVVHAMFAALPFAGVVGVVFIVLIFISFVTAMDSNTHSISSVCLKPNAPGGQQGAAALQVKLFWGGLIGAVAWIMTATTGIGGVRMLSNLGGAPGLAILIAMGAALIAMRAAWFDEVKSASQPAQVKKPAHAEKPARAENP